MILLVLAVAICAGTTATLAGFGGGVSATATAAATLATIAYYRSIKRRPIRTERMEPGFDTRNFHADQVLLTMHRHRMRRRLAQLEQSRSLMHGVFEVGAELLACRDEVEAVRRFSTAVRTWWKASSTELLLWERGRWRRVGGTEDEPEPPAPNLTGPMRLPDGDCPDLIIDLSPGVQGQAVLIAREAKRQPSLQELEREDERHLVEVLRSQLALSLRRVNLHQELARLGRTDPLTGCWRRWYGQQRLEELVEGGAVVAVIMCDIDRFKAVNDEHGHAAGDDVLRAIGTLLADSVRRGDLVFRYGGEEFVIILPDTGPLGTVQVAERMRSGIAGLKRLPCPVTASFGIACCHRDETASDLLRRVDEALYQAKTDGRNRIVNADADFDENLLRSTRRRVRRDDTTRSFEA